MNLLKNNEQFTTQKIRVEQYGNFTCTFFKNSAFNLEYYRAVHKNGFSITTIMKKSFVEGYFAYYIPFGSNHLQFRVDEKTKQSRDSAVPFREMPSKNFSLPEGTAHYLEHCIFDSFSENASDSFVNQLQNLGVIFNAYTTNDYTLHYGSGVNNILETVLLYAKRLFSLEISQERVELEREIILSELGMYEDDPDIKAYNQCLEMLFQKHPHKNEILGSFESIKAIQAKHLNLILHYFYKPSFIKLLLVADLEPVALCRMFDQLFEQLAYNDGTPEAEIINQPEPLSIAQAKKELSLDVYEESFYLAFKDKNYQQLYQLKESGEVKSALLEKYRLKVFSLLSGLFGNSAEFYNHLYYRNYINDTFSHFYVTADNIAYLVLNGQVADSQKSIAVLKEHLFAFGTDGKNIFNWLEDKLFEIQKRQQIGQIIQDFDSIKGLGNFLVQSAAKNLEVEEFLQLLLTIKPIASKEKSQIVLADLIEQKRKTAKFTEQDGQIDFSNDELDALVSQIFSSDSVIELQITKKD